jgi:predicted SAM-dependent methyltransferase
MNYIEFEGDSYPEFQAQGFAAKYILPFAREYCKGRGADVGFGKEEWKFPGSIGADLTDPANPHHAYYMPQNLDYIFSSHCLEHLDSWVEAIELWKESLVEGGCLFLYLPHPDQKYWRPWNNPKHRHILHPEDVKFCMEANGYTNIQVTGMDLNHSYAIVGFKG